VVSPRQARLDDDPRAVSVQVDGPHRVPDSALDVGNFLTFIPSPDGIMVRLTWPEAEETLLALTAAKTVGLGGDLADGLREAVEKRLRKDDD
jgi:hypothetical protein